MCKILLCIDFKKRNIEHYWYLIVNSYLLSDTKWKIVTVTTTVLLRSYRYYIYMWWVFLILAEKIFHVVWFVYIQITRTRWLVFNLGQDVIWFSKEIFHTLVYHNLFISFHCMIGYEISLILNNAKLKNEIGWVHNLTRTIIIATYHSYVCWHRIKRSSATKRRVGLIKILNRSLLHQVFRKQSCMNPKMAHKVCRNELLISFWIENESILWNNIQHLFTNKCHYASSRFFFKS